MTGHRATRAPNLAGPIERTCGRDTVRILRAVGLAAVDLGAEAYLVGGMVRDVLLGLASRDLDVVVVGDASSVGRRVAASRGYALRSHEAFGTARLTVDSETHIDLATARSESYRSPAALPTVEPAGLEEDLVRRDFTINAIAVRLEPRRFGVVVDRLGGLDDLSRRTLRVMHDRSFIDDPTRAFRGVRLGERLRLKLERRTASWMLAATRAGLVDRLSSRRLQREVALSFEEPALSRVARALARRELLAAIHPCLSLDGGRLEKLRRLDRALNWYGRGDRRPTPVRWVAALGSLTVGVPADSRGDLLRRLKPNRSEACALSEVPHEAPRILTRLARARRLVASRVREICDGAAVESLLVALASADRAVARALRSYLDVWRDVRLDIGGSDLLRAGLAPGPAVARGLAAALRAKLDGRAPDARRQLAVALESARRA